MLSLTPPAAAHDVGIDPYGYYVAPSGDQYLYRCAVGDNSLFEYSGILATDSTSISKSGVYCANNYSLNSGSIQAGYILIYWNQGNPENCRSGNVSNVVTDYKVTAAFAFAGAPCGSGTYSTTSLHNVYVLGAWRSAILSSGYHNF
jgi:hypothetical protein